MQNIELKQEIGRRIAKARTDKGLTLRQLADYSRNIFSSGRISNWEQGRRTPGIEETLMLSAILDVSGAYLLCLSDDDKIDLYRKAMAPPNYARLFDLADLKNELDPLSHAENINKKLDKSKLIPLASSLDSITTDQAVAVKLVDDSMSPEFKTNDLVIIEPNCKPTPGRQVLALCNAYEHAVFRTYRETSYNKEGGAEFELIATNTNWPIINSKDHHIEIIGGLVQVQRDY